MPPLEELVRDYRRHQEVRNRGLFSAAVGAGILSFAAPTFYDHWQHQLDTATMALDLFIALPALTALIGGGFYAARAIYLSLIHI